MKIIMVWWQVCPMCLPMMPNCFTVADFKEDYWPQLSETDKKLVALFFLRYDHRNLLAWLAEGDGAAFDERAMFPREAWPEAMEKVKTGDEQGRVLPLIFTSSWQSMLP